MIPNLLRLVSDIPSSPDPEDIFSTSLSTLFPDDLQVQHGDPGTRILYRNAVHGDLEFRCADVSGEEDRTKFAHYLWNAGVLMGEIVGGRDMERKEEGLEDEEWGRREFAGGKEWWIDLHEAKTWSVEGHRVLELGAGVGLAGIVSALVGAEEVAMTDYPSPILLDTLRQNAYRNISNPLPSHIRVEPHLWGDVSSDFATSNARRYTRILAADTLWLTSQHTSLASSMAHFLADDPGARVLVIAGFHTGRPKVAKFFDIIGDARLEVDCIWEMDSKGERRGWDPERPMGPGEGKKWVVLAVLKNVDQN